MKLQRRIALVALAILLSAQARSQDKQDHPEARLSEISSEFQQKLDVEKQTLEQRKFDFQKDLEAKKLDLDSKRIDGEWWTRLITLLGTLATVVGTISLGIYTVVSQLRSGSNLKEAEFKSTKKQKEDEFEFNKKLKQDDFAMKAAELVMAGNNPWVAKGRADALRLLFKQLPEDFGAKFDPMVYSREQGWELEEAAKHFKNAGSATKPNRSPQPEPDIPKVAVDATHPAELSSATADTPKAVVDLANSDDAIKKAWASEILKAQNLFLAYIYKPSSVPGQKYDVTIFLMRHVWGPEKNIHRFGDVEKASFYFGPSWGGVFDAQPVAKTNGFVGVNISAWGTFWATCTVKFRGSNPITIHRHIDFGLSPGQTDV